MDWKFLLWLVFFLATGQGFETINGFDVPPAHLKLFRDVETLNQNQEELIKLQRENMNLFYETVANIPTPLRTGLNEFLVLFQKALFKANEENNTSTLEELTNLQDCTVALESVINDTFRHQLYALKMFDSWGTPENGIIEANVRWPGHYYECWSAVGEAASGKWCNSYLGFRYVPYPGAYPIDITLGSCFPLICSETSVQSILNQLYPSSLLLEVTCPVPHYNLSTTDIIGIAISSVLVLLVGVATVVDGVERISVKEVVNKQHDENRSTGGKVLHCFSIISNGQQILDMTKRPGSIPVLDGIRFISTTWIILAHTFNYVVLGLDNASHAERTVKANASIMAISNGFFAVDTFFLLSGLLVTYLGLKQMKRAKGNLNVPLMYLQRYLRLTPTYAYLILFSIGLYKYVGAGPFWQQNAHSFHDMCIKDWFTNLLYINNFYPVLGMCFSWGWYLANDMQFYLLSPIFIFALYKKKMLGIALVMGVCVCSMLTTALLTYFNNLSAITLSISLQMTPLFLKEIAFSSEFYADAVGLVSWMNAAGFPVYIRFLIDYNTSGDYTYHDKFNYDTYTMPWCRISVYMIGMMTGFVLYDCKLKIRIHKAVVVLGWLLAAAAACAILYGPFDSFQDTTFFSRELSTFYETFARPTWGLCIAWVVIACTAGYGGPITSFLDWSVFTPLSRLTYSAYLVHLLVVFWYIGSQEGPLHYLTINVAYIYIGSLVITFGCAFMLALFIEWPMMSLMRLLFGRAKPKPPAVIPAHLQMVQEENKHDNLQSNGTEKPPHYSNIQDAITIAENRNGGTIPTTYVNDSYVENHTESTTEL